MPDGEHVVPLGRAAIVREGADVHDRRARGDGPARPSRRPGGCQADHGIGAEVIDLRTLVPLDVATILDSVEKTSRLFTVEENPRLCGWGAEIVSIVADEGVLQPRRADRPDHDAAHPAAVGGRRSRTPRIPSVDRIVETVRTRMEAAR